MNISRLSVFLAVLLFALCSTHSAMADAAPPPPPPGTSLEPGESVTNVQMLWEDVIMIITDNSAAVQAVFRFQNQGAETESFDVRFPLGVSVQGPITDFAASVDGVPAPIMNIQDGRDGSPWATWPTTFPQGVVVEVSVNYTVSGYRYNKLTALQEYSYVLATGAGWYGSIGEGTITVRLPHEANENTVCMGTRCRQQPHPSWYAVSGTDVVWQFTDLEPTEADNIGIVVLDPALYRSLLNARSQAQTNSSSLEAQLNLARLIRPAVDAGCGGIWDYGCSYAEGPTTDVIQEALAAYRRAVELAPGDADIHAEYLEYLISTENYTEEVVDELIPGLEYALTLDPDNERLIKICRGLEELGLWPPVTSSLTPSHDPMPTPSEEPAVIESLATRPALDVGNPSSPGNKFTAWLVIILILGLLFIGIASVIMVAARRVF